MKIDRRGIRWYLIGLQLNQIGLQCSAALRPLPINHMQLDNRQIIVQQIDQLHANKEKDKFGPQASNKAST